MGRSALDFALFGGEDYQLVFTIASDRLALLAGEHPPFSVVGEVTPDGGVVLVDAAGREASLRPQGYNHFR